MGRNQIRVATCWSVTSWSWTKKDFSFWLFFIRKLAQFSKIKFSSSKYSGDKYMICMCCILHPQIFKYKNKKKTLDRLDSLKYLDLYSNNHLTDKLATPIWQPVLFYSVYIILFIPKQYHDFICILFPSLFFFVRSNLLFPPKMCQFKDLICKISTSKGALCNMWPVF